MNRLKRIEIHIDLNDKKGNTNIIKRKMHKTHEFNGIMEVVKIKVSDNFELVKKKIMHRDNLIE